VGAHLPSIDTSGQGGASVTAQDQSDNPFLYGSADLDRLIAYSSGNLAYLLNDPTGSKDILEGTFGEEDGAHLNYTLFDTELTAGLYATQKFQFNITSIGVTMASSYHGEVQTGELGDAFIFSTPSTGDGSISIDTTYTLNGTLTNDSGIVGNITLDLTALNFEFLWPGLVDVELPGVHIPFGRDSHTPAFYAYQNTETFGGLDTANATYTVNYSESAAPGGGGTVENPPEPGQINFNGTDGDDWLYANGLDNIIRGYAGNDVIYGFDGNDTVYAGEGNDTISTAQGNDVIYAGGGNDTVYGGSGDDLIDLGRGDGWVDGGAGLDALAVDWSDRNGPNFWAFSSDGGASYSGGYDNHAAFEALQAKLATADAVVWQNDPGQTQTVHGVTVSGLERLLLATGAGDDTIRNAHVATDDHFDTGAGNDTIEAGGGNDTLLGGTGQDTAIYSGHRADYTISNPDGTGHFTITHNNGGADGTDTLSGIEKLQFADGTIDAPCFLRGTRLLTRHGYAPVETLQPGDELLTLRHGWQKLLWLGHRHIPKNAQGRFDHKVQPIRIVRDAFGVGLPSRDLWVSPEHAVYFRDHLIPAKSLVNGVTVIREPDVDAITYYHVLLERHSVVFSESLPTESYTPQENLDLFENIETCPEQWRSDAAAFIGRWAECHPRAASGPVVETARSYLARQPIAAIDQGPITWSARFILHLSAREKRAR
jgi:Ca2+-binding RTX toxin-like protein